MGDDAVAEGDLVAAAGGLVDGVEVHGASQLDVVLGGLDVNLGALRVEEVLDTAVRSLFSEIWESMRLTRRLLTMKSSAWVTAASSRLRTSSISLTMRRCCPSFSEMSRRWSRVTGRASAFWTSMRLVAEDDDLVKDSTLDRAPCGRWCPARSRCPSCS